MNSTNQTQSVIYTTQEIHLQNKGDTNANANNISQFRSELLPKPPKLNENYTTQNQSESTPKLAVSNAKNNIWNTFQSVSNASRIRSSDEQVKVKKKI